MCPVNDELPPLYSLTDLADTYGLSIDTLYDLARAGELGAFKIGRTWRVPLEGWQQFIDRRSAMTDGLTRPG